MSKRMRHLAGRIRAAFVELEGVVQRVEEAWRRAQQSADDFYLDSVALNLHGFYSGLEQIFHLIAGLVDGAKPQGENWHQALLRQMAMEIPAVRPAVLSEATRSRLDEYRGFRHVVRNVYSFKFDPVKLERLVLNVPSLIVQVRAEVLAFADFLEDQP